MKVILALLAALPLLAIDGTVINSTTGKPQPDVTVSVIAAGQGGMQPVGSARTDADGKFRIEAAPRGAHLLQAVYQGVPYNKMIDPNAPTTNVQINVFDPTTDRASAQVAQHIVFLQPSGEQLMVNEVFFVNNTTNKTYNNTADGALRFYVPGHTAQDASVRVSISTAGGMPVNRPAEATNQPGVYKVSYPVKPGETQFTIGYSVPGVEKFTSKTLQKLDTRLVVPKGVTLEGTGVSEIGADPSGKATLYSISGPEYAVTIGGAAAGSMAADPAETGQPTITQTRPRLYSQLPIVLALAFGVLMLGFIALYRAVKRR
jgi:hypothetical protein